MSGKAWGRSCLLTALLFCVVPSRSAQAFDIIIDYFYDERGGNFFGDPARRTALEAAVSVYEDLISDRLTAINPSFGTNTWSATFNNPATGLDQSSSNLRVPADSLIVYAGGYVLPNGSIGVGGPGGWSASGTNNWLDIVSERGQTNAFGENATDFAPWGGAITFNSETNWHFEMDSLPSQGESDFYSVALHELGHLLGLGTANSWNNLRNNSGQFTGFYSRTEYGGNIPMDGPGHWRDGIRSISIETGLEQEVALDPSIFVGSRKHLTELDVAGLKDVGWVVTIPRTLVGDANGDGRVDLADFQALKDGFGSGVRREQGDLNDDKVVDLNDFNLLKSNFGAGAAVAPEPATWTLLACGAGLLALSRLRIR